MVTSDSRTARAASVLVVEDDADIAAVLRTALEEGGYAVADAEDAAQAIDVLDSHPLDLVLLDCFLPGGGMKEVMAQADQRDSAIVLMSGDTEMMAQLAAFGYPCLRKPFGFSGLLATVEQALHRRTHRH